MLIFTQPVDQMTAAADLQTTDGREVTTTVTEAAADRWVITQKNKKGSMYI